MTTDLRRDLLGVPLHDGNLPGCEPIPGPLLHHLHVLPIRARLFQDRADSFATSTDVAIATINVTTSTDGTTATIAGTISDGDGLPSRSYTAALRKVGTVWKLARIQFADGVG